MTEKLADRSESERKKIVPEWGVAADDQIVLVGFVALVLILGTFAWNALSSDDDPGPLATPIEAVFDGDDALAGNDVDLSTVEAAYGVNGKMNGNVAVLTGLVADETTRDEAGTAAMAVSGVESVDNRLRIAENDEGSEGAGADENAGDVASEVTTTTTTPPTTVSPATATVAASDIGIVLSGTVPSEEVADSLRAAAAASYSTDEIDDQLVVTEGATSFDLTLTGTLGSQETLDAVSASFAAVSADQLDESLELDAGTAAAAALNELFQLEPILFESGTNVILADSLATLDRAVEILAEHPEAVVEIGGHTDSRGSGESNQALSQSRAEAVLTALTERGVTNEMTAVGFGEDQLLVDPDDTPEAQQANRRIEFTSN